MLRKSHSRDVVNPFSGSEKGSFGKGVFSEKSIFWRSREFRDSRDSREPQEVENKREPHRFLEILENLEILEIPPVQRPLRNDTFLRSQPSGASRRWVGHSSLLDPK